MLHTAAGCWYINGNRKCEDTEWLRGKLEDGNRTQKPAGGGRDAGSRTYLLIHIWREPVENMWRYICTCSATSRRKSRSDRSRMRSTTRRRTCSARWHTGREPGCWERKSVKRHSDRFRRRRDSKFHRFLLQRNPWQALVPLRHLQKRRPGSRSLRYVTPDLGWVV